MGNAFSPLLSQLAARAYGGGGFLAYALYLGGGQTKP